MAKFKEGDKVYAIERLLCGDMHDYSEYIFCAQSGNYAIVTPSIAMEEGFECRMKLHADETAENYGTALCVYPLEDVYATREEAVMCLFDLQKRA